MKCIVCLSDKDLNTHMKVEIDNENYEVHLCDEHAENTTMSQVNKKVKEIKDKLKNAVKLAIDLGISIPEINVNTSKDKMPDMNILPPSHNKEAVATQMQEQVIDKEELKNKIKREPAPVKISDNEVINCDTDIEMQEVEVKGHKIKIPKHTEGEAGVSEVKILNTDDNLVQKRFREIKNRADVGQSLGYISDCLACGGSGTHPVLNKECPKCNGTGLRS